MLVIKLLLILISIPLSFIGLGLMVGSIKELPSSSFVVFFFVSLVISISLYKITKKRLG